MSRGTPNITVKDNHQWEVVVPTDDKDRTLVFNSMDSNRTTIRVSSTCDGKIIATHFVEAVDLLQAAEVIKARVEK